MSKDDIQNTVKLEKSNDSKETIVLKKVSNKAKLDDLLKQVRKNGMEDKFRARRGITDKNKNARNV